MKSVLIIETEYEGHYLTGYIKYILRSFKNKKFKITLLTSIDAQNKAKGALQILRKEKVKFNIETIENLKVKKNLQSQWLPTACVIYKKDFLIGKYFNESFGAYSYLEDLDFSLQINPERQNIFLVVANAKFLHLKEVIRTSFVFGYYEFLNRYKIVRKFKLKKKSFFLMASCKIILTVFSILINYKNIFKLFGNITAIILCLIFY